MDLIWLPRGKAPVGIECKWSARDLDPANLLVFARAYPEARLLVTTPDARPSFSRDDHGVQIDFLTLDRLVDQVRSGMVW